MDILARCIFRQHSPGVSKRRCMSGERHVLEKGKTACFPRPCWAPSEALPEPTAARHDGRLAKQPCPGRPDGGVVGLAVSVSGWTALGSGGPAGGAGASRARRQLRSAAAIRDQRRPQDAGGPARSIPVFGDASHPSGIRRIHRLGLAGSAGHSESRLGATGRREERGRFKLGAARDGIPGYHIKSVTPGGLVRSEEHDEYFPILYFTRRVRNLARLRHRPQLRAHAQAHDRARSRQQSAGRDVDLQC